METYCAPKDFRRVPWRSVLLAISLCLIGAHAFAEGHERDHGLRRIKHIVVIYQENWSFDSLFPDFPGANGINNATTPQVDKQSSLPGVKSWTLSVVSAQHSRALAVASQTTNTSYSR